MRLLFVVVTALIAYGSLYPFNFAPWDSATDGFGSLLSFSTAGPGLPDKLQNLLLFLPLGLIGMQLMSGPGTVLRVLVLFLFAFNLSFGLQVAQLWVPGRVPSGADTVLNLIGFAAGGALGLLPRARRLRGSVAVDGRPPVPLLLALAWMLYQWAPFVPSLDPEFLYGQFRALVLRPRLSPVWTFQGVVTWLVIFHLLRGTAAPRLPEHYFPLLALIVVGGGLLISGNTAKADRVLGALLALPLWLLLRQRQRPRLLAGLMLLLIGAIQLTPFELRAFPVGFSWVPFSGALGGNMLINVLATAKKLILYGSCIWLCAEAGLRLRTATALVAALLLLSEFLQTCLRSGTPEVTDALLALAMGFAMGRYQPAALAGTGARAYGGPPGRTGRVARRPRKRHLLGGALLIAAAGAAYVGLGARPGIDAPSWAGTRAVFVPDSHTRTRFSDGALTPAELVALAVDNGCNALAVTDHSGRDAAVPAQLQQLNRLRGRFPGLVLLAGAELNLPSDDYAALLAGLKAGTFWADHGRILDELLFSVQVDGVPRAAVPGAVVTPAGADPPGFLHAVVASGPGAADAALQVELISNCRRGRRDCWRSSPCPRTKVPPGASFPATNAGPTGAAAICARACGGRFPIDRTSWPTATPSVSCSDRAPRIA